MTNYNERLDEILSNIDSIGYSWLEGREEAKQAILSDLLEIIGEDAPEPVWKGADDYLYNKLRQELREKVKKYCE